jgi:tetratricopeptide (TPR) repeat protein
MLLARPDHASALTVLKAGLTAFPHDMRLRQLMGLYCSRTGEFDEALKCLVTLLPQFPEEDETLGILAGVYKRLWQRDADHEQLVRCHQAYRKGWKRSRGTNAYLGINAATTALWLGQLAESRQLADKVRTVLHNRIESLVRHGGERASVLTFWDQVTLAEAELLLGQSDAARPLYQHAHTQFADLQENIAVSKRQAVAILRSLGLNEEADSFFGQ